MKKRIGKFLGLALVPAGALFLNACGPVEMTEPEVTLDETSDNWTFINGVFSEYGHCNNAVDDNGNGLVDGVDPDCHVNPGPLRDLSIFDFPIGHNYFPDIRMDLPGGPGFLGNFRDPELIVRWFRFLTEPDGWVAGNFILGPGVNPEVVPVPGPLAYDSDQGSFHPGNNNDIGPRALHVWDMFHPGLVPAPAAAAAVGAAAATGAAVGAASAQAPGAGALAAQKLSESSFYTPTVYTKAIPLPGGWPGAFYAAGENPFKRTVPVGKQGAIRAAAETSNPR